MRTFYRTLSLLLVALSISAMSFIGCDGAIDSEYKEQLIVTGFIYPGSPIDSVVVQRTTPFGEKIDDLTSSVDSAVVKVTVDGTTHTLLPGSRKGRYYLPASELVVEGGKSYTLTVDYHEHHLSAVTTVPEPIHWIGLDDSLRHTRDLILDTTDYGAFRYTLTAGPIDYVNRKYMLKVLSLDTNIGRIHTPQQGPPFDSTGNTRYSFIQTAPVLPLSGRLFGWYGPQKISVLAIDTNWVDYTRQTFGGGDPSGFQQSLNHIDGGIGIWGSAAVDTVTIYLKPKE